LILSQSAGKSKVFSGKIGLDFGKNIRFQKQNAMGRTVGERVIFWVDKGDFGVKLINFEGNP